MRNFIVALLLALALMAAMAAEYLYIMYTQIPYIEGGGTVYIECLGMVHEYYADDIGELIAVE